MNKKMTLVVLSAVILVLSTVPAFARDAAEDEVEKVYSMTNDPAGNQVVIFSRDEDGLLTKESSFPTGGKGSGGGLDPLGSQNSLILTPDNRWLLAVNGGSSDISVFRVSPKGLALVDRVASEGVFPVSVAIDRDLVYVLSNATASANISGFTLSHTGHLTPLAGSIRSLPSTGSYAQVGFDREGERLVVTDKAENLILVYALNDDGSPALTPVTNKSNGNVPFGFIFDRRGHLLVVEVGPNAVSSYNILSDNTLEVISGSVPNGQKTACWIAGHAHGDIFTANPATPGGGTVSSYKLTIRSGQVSLVNGAAGKGTNPLDLAITKNGRFLYALDPGSGSVDMFQIEEDGSLNSLGAIHAGLSIFAQGLAGY